MKTILLATLIFFGFSSSNAQIVSKFTWNGISAGSADMGPDAISISSSAVIATGGQNGTTGLNPGNPKKNLDLVLPGAIFDIPGIDISINFRREEAEASFFTRGSVFDFGMNGGNLSVKFRVKDQNGNTTNINSGNVFNIPTDGQFHNYRFRFDYSLGVAAVIVDQVTVYSHDLGTGFELDWTGAGNAVIGKNMDGSGKNIVILDNMQVMNTPLQAILPLTLLKFSAEARQHKVELNWETSNEDQVNRIEVQRSSNSRDFSTINTLAPSNQSNLINKYQSVDSAPLKPVAYYRLKMIDNDGKFRYSEIKAVSLGLSGAEMSVFPNPATDFVNLKIQVKQPTQYRYSVISADGKLLQQKSLQLNNGLHLERIDLTRNNVAGLYIIVLEDMSTNLKQSFKVSKR